MKLSLLFFVLLMPLCAYAYITVEGTITRTTWTDGLSVSVLYVMLNI